MTGGNWQSRIDQVARDHTHGASELTLWAAQALQEAADQKAPPEDLRLAVGKLLRSHRSMAPLLRLCLEVLKLLVDEPANTSLQATTSRWIQELQQAEGHFHRHLIEDVDRAGHWAFFSYSSTVLSGLRALAGRGVTGRALVAESRPGAEGRNLAAGLAASGWQTMLVPDALFMDRVATGHVEKLILGCDAADDRIFVNKVGSGSLAAAMRHAGGKVEIWATSHKLLPTSGISLLGIEEVQSEEFSSEDNQVAVEAPLFGVGDLKHINLFRGEWGAWTLREIKHYVEELHQLTTPPDRRFRP